MGLFGSKKKSGEPVRTLSEREIQSRLYGHLRQPGPVQEDLPSLSKPKHESSLYQKTTSISGKTLTPSAASASHKPSISAPELFESPEAEAEAVGAKSIPDSALRTRETSYSKPQPAKPKTGRSSLHMPSTDALQKTAGKFAQTAGDILKTIALRAAGVLGLIIATVLRVFTAVDFKKPAVRRAFSIVFGISFMILIFFGIHLLNVSREAAMKNPARPAPVVARTISVPQSEEGVLIQPAEQTKKSDSKDKKSKKEEAAQTPAASENAAPAKTSEVKMEPVNTAPKTEVKKTAAPAAAPAITGPAYVVQVATFAAKEDAQKLMERFNADSLSAFIKPLSRSGGRVYYCVFLGKFKTHEEADAALAGFKKKEIAQPFQDAFVRLMQ
jgi:cell division septation protein DedD